MSTYEGVHVPNPERQRLFKSVLHPAPLDEVARAISAATEVEDTIYVERVGGLWRWSLVTKGGPYPLLRITAQYLQIDYTVLVGVGSKVVGDDYCVQIVDEDGPQADAWGVLEFGGPTAPEDVVARIVNDVAWRAPSAPWRELQGGV